MKQFLTYIQCIHVCTYVQFPALNCPNCYHLMQSNFLNIFLEQSLYELFFQVYSNLSGLVILSEEGEIESCNINFLNLLLGYSMMDLKGKVLIKLIIHVGNISGSQTIYAFTLIYEVNFAGNL